MKDWFFAHWKGVALSVGGYAVGNFFPVWDVVHNLLSAALGFFG